MEVIGFRGAPGLTLQALQSSLHGSYPQMIAILVTAHQGHRQDAGYAVYLRHTHPHLLTQVAFGPAFGAAGQQALAQMIHWLVERGVTHFYEAVVSPAHLAELLGHSDSTIEKHLLAVANPADYRIYLSLPTV